MGRQYPAADRRSSRDSSLVGVPVAALVSEGGRGRFALVGRICAIIVVVRTIALAARSMVPAMLAGRLSAASITAEAGGIDAGLRGDDRRAPIAE